MIRNKHQNQRGLFHQYNNVNDPSQTIKTNKDNLYMNKQNNSKSQIIQTSQQIQDTIKTLNLSNLIEKERDYLEYKQRFKDETTELCFKITKQDIFNIDENISIAHCISSDFKMSEGIAADVKQRFGPIDKKTRMNARVGECFIQKHSGRYIFHLITKEFYYNKPTYKMIEQCLSDLLWLCEENKLKRLAMPKIACGLDQLDWNIVSKIIHNVFKNSIVQVTVYDFNREVLKISQNNSSEAPIKGKAILNNTLVEYLLDSGADVSVINHELFEQIKQDDPYTRLIEYKDGKIKSYTNEIKVLGKVILQHCFIDVNTNVEMVVVQQKTNAKCIIGRDLVS